MNKKKPIKNPQARLYYIIIIAIALAFIVYHYPSMYGVDAFQVMWMGHAIKHGALFSEQTWLIHPASPFGFYPFSHRAIGIPIVLAFFMTLIEILSFGLWGLPETILLFNIIILLILYKCSRNLAETIFQEEWSKIVFVAALLFCPRMLHSNVMEVSTRIVITICMLVLINLNLKVLNNSIKNYKAVLYIPLILMIGAFSHRLSLALLLPVAFMIFLLIIRKFKELHHLTVFLILPSAILAYFYGLESFSTYIGNNYTELEAAFNLIVPIPGGLLSPLYAFGVIASIYRLTYSFEEFNKFKPSISTSTSTSISISLGNRIDQSRTQNKRNQVYYLLLFIIPFCFTILTSFYAYVLFMPIIIFFSVQGLIYAREIISNYCHANKVYLLDIKAKLTKLTHKIRLTLVKILSLAYIQKIIAKISKFKDRHTLSQPFKRINCQTIILTGILGMLMTYTILNIEYHKTLANNSPYPWENRHLSDEEAEIIDYFQAEEPEGLILVPNRFISERLAGVGFLPTISSRSSVGMPLYYGLISPNEVYENTHFSISYYVQLSFFEYNATDPVKELTRSISGLDLSKQSDFDAFRSYNIQYIIVINETHQPGGIHNWKLLQSIPDSNLVYANQSVFETEHFVIWRIY
ncbi:MAG: hypothetical protein ACOC44_15810 [Promethearchaeia archaeon]